MSSFNLRTFNISRTKEGNRRIKEAILQSAAVWYCHQRHIRFVDNCSNTHNEPTTFQTSLINKTAWSSMNLTKSALFQGNHQLWHTKRVCLGQVHGTIPTDRTPLVLAGPTCVVLFPTRYLYVSSDIKNIPTTEGVYRLLPGYRTSTVYCNLPNI